MEECKTRWLLEQRACSSRTEYEGLIGGVRGLTLCHLCGGDYVPVMSSRWEMKG